MERECLDLVSAITNQFHCYLYGSKFKVRTDNRPLSWLRTLTRPQPRIALWILQLQEYEFDVVHRPGSNNQNADALSRLPLNAIFIQSDHSKSELLNKQKADPDCQMLMKALEVGVSEDQSGLAPFQRSLISRIR